MSFDTQINNLAKQVGEDIKTLSGYIGSLDDLTTTAKASLVVALNELKASLGTQSSAGIDDDSTSSSTTWSSSKISTAVSDAITALVNGAPETLDTLKELADAIETNGDAISALQTIAAGHVKYDEAQSLTDEQQTQARDNIGAASAADLSTLQTTVAAIDLSPYLTTAAAASTYATAEALTALQSTVAAIDLSSYLTTEAAAATYATVGALTTLAETVSAIDLSPYLTTSNAANTYVPVAGGTMTGALILSGDPTDNLQAATKQYVDNAISENAGSDDAVLYTAQSLTSAQQTQARTNIDALGTQETAVSAEKLATARTITLGGYATGTVTFDGSEDVTLNVELKDTGTSSGSFGLSSNVSPAAGESFTVPYFTVDTKGRVTTAENHTVTLPDTQALTETVSTLVERVTALESRLSDTPAIVGSLDEVEDAENDGYFWVPGLYDEEETEATAASATALSAGAAGEEETQSAEEQLAEALSTIETLSATVESLKRQLAVLGVE